ncbi:MAG TPA: fructosamine kinase [Alphaproteobacteria bacterium]|nr:fructosamine kinase [Alphaproteobacteria bacterium]
MRGETKDLIRQATGQAVVGARPLAGGCVGEVLRVELENGEIIVAKTGEAGGGLAVEGRMLSYLSEMSALPTPCVLYADDRLLLMTYIPNSGGLNARSQAHAAELLAALHGVTAKNFGLDFDTPVGGLRQPNTWQASWRDFFRDQRLLYMGRVAMDAGRLPGRLFGRLEALAGRLDKWLDGNEKPSLVHGDMWTGNVLCRGGRIAGFVDPAIYYGEAETELAFSTMFATFGDSFFRRYHELRPIRAGFFEERREIYNLYPLLVHARLFGGSYVQSVEGTLSRFGF